MFNVYMVIHLDNEENINGMSTNSIYLLSYSMVSLFKKRFDSFVRIYCRFFEILLYHFNN